MEEDIEILEDYAYAMCTISSTTEKDKRIAQAIENLINRNKELKEKCASEYTRGFVEGLHDSISKSKVRDKLEENEENKRYYDEEGIIKDHEYYRIEGRIEFGEELLQEE